MNEFLLQRDWRDKKINELGTTNWVTVYLSSDSEEEKVTIFSALIPKENVDQSLKNATWEKSIGYVQPGSVTWYEDGKPRVEYSHFTDKGSVQPLVLIRDFRGVRPKYIEILEEFRLFHNLYYDKNKDVYLKLFNNGDEDEVVRIKNKNVEIRLRELLQFISWKQMCLAIYYEIDRFSELSPTDIDDDEEKRIENYANASMVYTFFIADDVFFSPSKFKTFSRLYGKKLIFGSVLKDTDEWPNEDIEQFEEFIIGTDSRGADVVFSSNPENLANFFGSNPENPSYLKPIFFRKEILLRYFGDPEKFTVHDGLIERNGNWILRVDNHHADYVIVFLGDLGSELPYSEQRIWRSYNIPPDGNLSEVTYKRAILAEFTEPSEPALKFKSVFSRFQENWNNKFGWYLFKQLSSEDEHHFIALHAPISDSQAEFDSQILSLTKILIDSLNEAEISRLITSEIPSDTKGIGKFEIYLNQEEFSQTENVVNFMRTLQSVRSISAAHRKGSDYDARIRKAGIDPEKLKSEFERLINEAIDSVISLWQFFLDLDEET